MRKGMFLFAALFFAGFLQGTEPRCITTEKPSGPILLDGKLTEPAWGKIPWQENFSCRDGKKAKEQTRFKFLAGQQGLFFAFEVKDSNIKSKYMKHDGPLWHDDCIEIFILPKPEPDIDPNIRDYRHFIFNPAGVRFEQSVRGGVGSPAWNVPWKVAVTKNQTGYDAEVFIPYYAMNPVGGVNTWRLNIARENWGPMELSSWSPTKDFNDTEKFGILTNIPVDFSPYEVSFHISDIGMKSIDGKIVPLVNGILHGKDKKHYTVRIAVRENSGNQKTLAAFNSTDVTPLQGKAAVSIPLEITKSGEYAFEFAVVDPTGRIVCYEEKKIAVNIASFEVRLLQPHYRNNIYLALPDPRLRLSVNLFVQSEALKKSTLSAVVIDSAGKTVAVKKLHSPAKSVEIDFDASAFAPGEYLVKTVLDGTKTNDGEFTQGFNVIARQSKGNLITLDPERRVLLNGKPFFPSGFYGLGILPTLQKSGYNLVVTPLLHYSNIDRILAALDKLHQHGMFLAFNPRHKIRGDFFGYLVDGKKERSLSAAAYKKIENLVNAVKDHPAFFGWYLYDEPRGAELTADLKRQYEFLRKIDPGHPVLGGDNSAGGCIAKAGHCDIHILDLYYRPRFNASPTHSMASLFNSVQSILDSTGEAVLFMPQAFHDSSYSGEKAMKIYRSPTYIETRAMVFGTIAAGAAGIVPFKLGNPKCKYFTVNPNSGIFFSPEMKYGWLEGLGPEIRNLSPVLLAEKIPVKYSSDKLRIAGRKLNGKFFVIAVNPQTTSEKTEIVWPDSSAEKLRILGEKRSVMLNKGKLVQTLAPYAVQVYTDDENYPDGVDIAAVSAKIAQDMKAVKAE